MSALLDKLRKGELMIDFSWTRVSNCYKGSWFQVPHSREGVRSIRWVPIMADCWTNVLQKIRAGLRLCKLIQWRQRYGIWGYIKFTWSLPSYVRMGALLAKSRIRIMHARFERVSWMLGLEMCCTVWATLMKGESSDRTDKKCVLVGALNSRKLSRQNQWASCLHLKNCAP